MKEIHTFLDVNSFLEFVDNTIRNHISSAKKQVELKKLSEHINARINDDNLYLGVLGEFSSGKSTFINGILQKRILKAAYEATTASSTYIVPSTVFKVITTFIDNQKISASESNYDKLYNKIASLAPKDITKESNIFQLLDLLTSHQIVANNVINIIIEYPVENVWQKNLIIIDTPGISSGTETGQSHFNITKNIIENVADAVVVLIPSEKAMSKSLIEFLKEHLKRFLHRCIFILTAVDRISPEERGTLVKYVKAQLQEKLGIKTPEVHISSAITMIPVSKIPSTMNDEWATWQNKFIDLKNKIFESLKRQRNVIISERLSYLMQNLVVEINKELVAKQENLRIEESILKKGSIQRVEDVINSLLEINMNKINLQKSKLISLSQSSISSYEVNAIRACEKIIDEAGSGIVSYESVIEPNIRAAIEKEAARYVASLNDNIGILQTFCNEICKDFIKQFKGNYETFDTLDVKIKAPSLIVNSIKTPSLEFKASKRYVDQQESEGKSGGNAGAVIGGIIGSFIFPGFGTVIGAALGGGIGHSVSGDSLTERQKNLKNYSKNEIKLFFGTFLKDVEGKINNTIKEVVRELTKICDNHINEYEERVSDTISKHKEKEKKLKSQIKVINGLCKKCQEFKETITLTEIKLNQI